MFIQSQEHQNYSINMALVHYMTFHYDKENYEAWYYIEFHFALNESLKWYYSSEEIRDKAWSQIIEKINT